MVFDGNFYDADYFERGKQSGKGWLENYHWLPRRSFREAFAFIDYFGLDESAYVLDFGTAKGFLVRAFRELEINADGCDISKYALSVAPSGCWNCNSDKEWERHVMFNYTHITAKDVFEHLNPLQLQETLLKLSILAKNLMCVIPMGDDGVYRIPEYHTDISHQIIEDEVWWTYAFKKAGWHIIKSCEHVAGLKDSWMTIPNGNHVFVLKFTGG